jgi:zinc and cadmium transporter
MESVWAYTLISVFIVSFLSFIGILILALQKNLLQRILIFLVSFAIGALLADPFLHILPEAIEEGADPVFFGMVAVLGMFTFFVIDKFLRWRHRHLLGQHKKHNVKPYVWLNLMGDGIHNFIDGALIAGSYLISVPLGITTTLAVIIHEGAQELGDFAVLISGGLSKTKALFYNFLSALAAVMGGVLTLLIESKIGTISSLLIPFTFAGFLYIALANLLPELHHEETPKKLWIQTTGIALGIAVMAALLLLE